MSHKISELPLDEIPPSKDEETLISWMFAPKYPPTETKPTLLFLKEFKTFLLLLIIYVIFHLGWFDSVLKHWMPLFQASPLLLTAVKGLFFIVILFYLWNSKYLNKQS